MGGSSGAITVWYYDNNGMLDSVVGPADRGMVDTSLTVTIQDAFHQASPLVHTGDWVVQNTYDGFDRVAESLDALGNETEDTFDPSNNIIQSNRGGPAGGTTPIDRSGTNNVPLSTSINRFDEAGRLYESQQNIFLNTGIPGGSPTHALPSTRTATHTGGGLVTNSTANNHTGTITLTTGGSSYVLSRTVYDRADRTVQSIADNTAVSTTAYDGASRQILVTDALNNLIAFTYDGNGNTVQVTRTDVCTITSPTVANESFVSATFYDCLNRTAVTAMQGPNGSFVSSVVQSARTAWSNLPVSPLGWSTATGTIFNFRGYDSRGNSTLTIDPKGNSTITDYDGASRSILNRQLMRIVGDGNNGPEAGSSFLPGGRAVIRTEMVYDGNSRISALIDDRGAETGYTHDLLDRQVTMTFQDGSTRTSGYDMAGDVTSYTDENGSVFVNVFDALGRKVSTSLTLATGVVGTTAQSFQYDGLSRRTFARDSIGSSNTDATFRFDSLGRLIEEGESYGS